MDQLPPSTVDGRQGVSQPTEIDQQMAYVQSIIDKVKAGMKPTPEEIAAIRVILGDAPTEDSEGYWGGGANGMGMTGVNMPDQTYGGDPIFTPLGEAPGGAEPMGERGGMSQRIGPSRQGVPLHKRL